MFFGSRQPGAKPSCSYRGCNQPGPTRGHRQAARYRGVGKILGLVKKTKLVMMVPSRTRQHERKNASHEAALWLFHWIEENGVCKELMWNLSVGTAIETKGTRGDSGKYHRESQGEVQANGTDSSLGWYVSFVESPEGNWDMGVSKRENNLHFLSYALLITIFLLESFFCSSFEYVLKNQNHFTHTHTKWHP